MNKYETIMIINSTLEEKEIESTIEKFVNLINENGKVTTKEIWGKRKLAYPIQKKNEGFYVQLVFRAESDFIDELNRIYNITDEVMKHIIVRIEN